MESFFLNFFSLRSNVRWNVQSCRTEKTIFEFFLIFSHLILLNVFYRQNLVRNSLESLFAPLDRSETECERVFASKSAHSSTSDSFSFQLSSWAWSEGFFYVDLFTKLKPSSDTFKSLKENKLKIKLNKTLHWRNDDTVPRLQTTETNKIKTKHC